MPRISIKNVCKLSVQCVLATCFIRANGRFYSARAKVSASTRENMQCSVLMPLRTDGAYDDCTAQSHMHHDGLRLVARTCLCPGSNGKRHSLSLGRPCPASAKKCGRRYLLCSSANHRRPPIGDLHHITSVHAEHATWLCQPVGGCWHTISEHLHQLLRTDHAAESGNLQHLCS